MWVSLSYEKILKFDHNGLVLVFIRMQVDQFDDFFREAEEGAVNPEMMGGSHISPVEGSTHTVMVPLSPTGHLVVLGLKQKVLSAQELLGQKVDSVMFTSFCLHISLAIQALSPYPAETVAIGDSHQVWSLVLPMRFSFLSNKFDLDHRVSFHQGEIWIDGQLVCQDGLFALQPKVLWKPTVQLCHCRPTSKAHVCATCFCLHMSGQWVRLPPCTCPAIGKTVPSYHKDCWQEPVNPQVAHTGLEQVWGDSPRFHCMWGGVGGRHKVHGELFCHWYAWWGYVFISKYDVLWNAMFYFD